MADIPRVDTGGALSAERARSVVCARRDDGAKSVTLLHQCTQALLLGIGENSAASIGNLLGNGME
jgi:hypothetical protein